MDAAGRGGVDGEIKYYFPIKRYYLPLDETRRITEPISAFTLLFCSTSVSPFPLVSPPRSGEGRNENEREVWMREEEEQRRGRRFLWLYLSSPLS